MTSRNRRPSIKNGSRKGSANTIDLETSAPRRRRLRLLHRRSNTSKSRTASQAVQELAPGQSINSVPNGNSQNKLWLQALDATLLRLADRDRAYMYKIGFTSAILDRQHLESFMNSLQSSYGKPLASRILHRVSPIMSHIQSFGRIVDIMVQSNPTISALVWGGVRLFIEISIRAVRLHEKILELLEDLFNKLPLFERWCSFFPKKTYPELSDCIRNTCISYFEFLVNAIKFLRRNAIKNMLLTICSCSFETIFEAADRQIRRQTKDLDYQVQAAAIQRAQENHQAIYGILQSHVGVHADKSPLQINVRLLRYTLQCARNDAFFGRQDFLSQLETEFKKGLITANDRRLTSVVLHGLGGFGKSSTALEYIHIHWDTYPVIIWLYADKTDKLDTQFIQIARILGFSMEDTDVTKGRETVLHWITHLDVDWLIVFDNADDVSLLQPYWPSSRHGCIIITSRNSFTGRGEFASEGLKITAFEEDEGADFLLSFLDHLPDLSKADLDAAKLISRHFDGLPLALRQAASFMRHRKCPPCEFLDNYSQCKAEVESMKIPGYTKTVVDVWEMSLSVLPQDSLDMLDLLAVLDPDVIPAGLFRKFGHHSPLSAFLEDDKRYMNARASLADQSLIDVNIIEESISLHRFFQDATFQHLKVQESRLREVFCAVTEMVDHAIPQDDYLSMKHPDIWKAVETYLAHAEKLYIRLRYSPDLPALPTSTLLDIYCKIAGYYYETAQYTLCESTLKDASWIVEHATSPINRRILSQTYYYHGRMCQEVNRTVDAIRDFKKAVELVEEAALTQPALLESTYLAILYENIGMSCTGAEKYDEAEKYLRLCIAIGSKHGAATHVVLGDFMQCLGACYFWRKGPGDLARAEDILQRALLQLCGANNENRGGALYTLGNVFLKQGRYPEALEKHKEVLKLYIDDCGAEHQWVADSLHKVGSILAIADFEGRDLRGAENCLRKCLEIWDAPRNRESEYSAAPRMRTYWRLSQILFARGGRERVQEAKRLCTEVCAFVKERLNITITRDMLNADEVVDRLVFYWNR